MTLCLCGERFYAEIQSGLGLRESPPVKLNRFAHVTKKIIRIVAAGVQMKLVLHAFRQQFLVHPRGPVCKAEFILLPAVDVDGLRLDLDLIFPRQIERIVLLPMRDIDGITKNSAQQASPRPGGAQRQRSIAEAISVINAALCALTEPNSSG